MLEVFKLCDTVFSRSAPYQLRIWFDKYKFVPLQTMGSAHLGSAPDMGDFESFILLQSMAKSKAGGTRTYIRGRVGSDVYSIGRDAKGKKQQVVRSLAESVSNPQTLAQMKGRMIMSTIAQAMAVLRPIIDHSFDGVVGARANISEFVSRNYALIKADVQAHAASGNLFGLNQYQEKGAKQGAYVISDGNAVIPSALVLNQETGVINIMLPSDNVTMNGLKEVLGLTSDEYFTLVGITAGGAAAYERFRINSTVANNTALNSDTIAAAFKIEGNVSATITIAANVISISLASIANCCAVIISKQSNGKYVHNEARLGAGTDLAWNADAALPTYPVGAQNYLNGGDIFGLTERGYQGTANEGVQPGGGEDPGTVTPSEYALTLSKTGSGSVVIKNASNQTIESGSDVAAGSVVSLEITPEAGKQATAMINGTSVSLTVSDDKYVGTFNMPNRATSLVVNTAYEQGSGDSSI